MREWALAVQMGSYRTYEEWKHSTLTSLSNSVNTCSYRTYEEWKRETIHAQSTIVERFLPYL